MKNDKSIYVMLGASNHCKEEREENIINLRCN